MDPTEEMYVIADELRSIADLGLHFAESNYDNDRYKRVRSLSARLVAAIENRPTDDVMEEYMGPLVRATPFVCAEAAVFQEERILLVRREDNGLWAMPGGATEVGLTWAESAERELREETGVQGAAKKLLGVFDSRLWRSRAKQHLYVSVWLVELRGRQIPVAGPETTGVGFFSEEALPDLSPGHRLRVPAVFKLVRGDLPVPYFDSTTHSDA